MSKQLRVGVGLLMVVVGVVWTGQGLGIIGGSVMSGEPLWAVVGPVVALLGAGLAVTASRRPR
jgi:hypothetical protein